MDNENRIWRQGGLFSTAKIIERKDGAESVYYKFSTLRLFRILISIFLFSLDYITDIVVSIKYYRDGDTIWFIMIISLMVTSAVVVQIFSIMWSTSCCEKGGSAQNDYGPCFFLSHLFLLSQVQRKLYLFQQGRKKRSLVDHKNYLGDLHDSSLMDLIETFIESAPQVVLQIYILLVKENSDFITTASVLISGLSVALSLIQYCNVLREYQYIKEQRLAFHSLVIMFIWRYTLILCRSTFLGLFAAVYSYFVFVLMAGHWLICTAYLLYSGIKNGPFSGSRFKEIFYCILGGFMYIFCVFNLKKGPSRIRYSLYYVLSLLEILCTLVVMIQAGQFSQTRSFAIFVVLGGYFMGLLCMAAYYLCFQPNRNKYLPDKFHCLLTTRFYDKNTSNTVQRSQQDTVGHVIEHSETQSVNPTIVNAPIERITQLEQGANADIEERITRDDQDKDAAECDGVPDRNCTFGSATKSGETLV